MASRSKIWCGRIRCWCRSAARSTCCWSYRTPAAGWCTVISRSTWRRGCSSCSTSRADAPSSFHRELARERDLERERLRALPRLHRVRDPLEARRYREDLLLRALPGIVQSLERIHRRVADLLLHDLEVIAWAVNSRAADHIGHLAEVRHRKPWHVDRRHERGRRLQRAVRIAFQHLPEHFAVERV